MTEKKDVNRHLLYLWYVKACGPDASFAYKLYCKYDSIEKLYQDSFYEGVNISDEAMKRLCDKRLDSAREIIKRCAGMGIHLMCIEDEEYPEKLRKIKDPPVLLFYKGKLINFDNVLCIGMVGTRKMTDYGKKTAEYLAKGVADCGAVIISGLAKGVDGTCQRTAIANGGYTVGVLGNTIDTIYPKENAALFNRLYSYGLVISEYWPGCQTTRFSFPKRNRIIAGLSDLVVVVEAPSGSGALITAEHARKQGKAVCVPPMPLTKENAGTAALLRGGAKLVTSVSDILGEYEDYLPHTLPPDAPLPTLKEPEDKYESEKLLPRGVKRELAYNYVMEQIEEHGPITLHAIAAGTEKYTYRELSLAATALELDGFAVRLPGALYDALPADAVPKAIKAEKD